MNDKEKVVTQIHKAIEMSRRPGASKEAYFAYHQDFTRRMYDITRAKNADYTGGSDSPFANFINTQIFAGVTPEQGILVRLNDKMSRIKSLLTRKAAVKDETIEDTILDAANYLVILAAYLKTEKPNVQKQQPELED